MKKTPKWAPRFDDKLRQSRLTKLVPRMKTKGYKLYCVYEDTEVKTMAPTVSHSPYGRYSVQLNEVITIENRYAGTKWLKPKHVTLLRMQGKQVVEANSQAYENPPIDFVRV